MARLKRAKTKTARLKRAKTKTARLKRAVTKSIAGLAFYELRPGNLCLPDGVVPLVTPLFSFLYQPDARYYGERPIYVRIALCAWLFHQCSLFTGALSK